MKKLILYIMLIYGAGEGEYCGTLFGDICYRHGVPKLYSALNDKKAIEKYDKPTIPFIDSGAHSWTKHNINKLGHKTLKPPPPVLPHAKFYPHFIEKHKDKNFLFVELDTYHTNDLGIDYVNGMYRDIMSIRGNFKFIRVYHPYLDRNNKPLTTLKKWLDEDQDYIGISKDSEHLYGEIFDITRDKIKLHGFALTGPTVISKYPFYSVDSTTCLTQPTKYHGIPVAYAKYLNKADTIMNEDINYIMCQDFLSRLERAAAFQKKAMDYYTKLWAERGVIWK